MVCLGFSSPDLGSCSHEIDFSFNSMFDPLTGWESELGEARRIFAQEQMKKFPTMGLFKIILSQK